ncbi:hypothetical protein QTP70_014317 [Hemibagrus guttatus]|uniref:Uncharacterized protein n=1 Tax=Hemibagrus guttatus TaxID=175788 RepID=A0AAE0V0F9_9TELE|nr:hypothetical protein QTP70_014317 [Hemibagrus guttatus]KAK3562365.1 hypothetical protein QTP86_033440 [Hemibagrus guttatus]
MLPVLSLSGSHSARAEPESELELLTHESIEKIVEGITERQQQQQQQQQKQTKMCLAYGQPKSHNGNYGSSVHFFLISKALSYTSTVPKRSSKLTVLKD